jgi:hypothetical protein
MELSKEIILKAHKYDLLINAIKSMKNNYIQDIDNTNPLIRQNSTGAVIILERILDLSAAMD